MGLDIKIDRRTGDIDLSSGTVQVHTDNAQSMAQKIKLAILTRKGEWFKNILLGVPYNTEFLRVKNNKTFIDQFMVRYITNIEGVTRVITYRSELDKAHRRLDIVFSVLVEDGTITSPIDITI